MTNHENSSSKMNNFNFSFALANKAKVDIQSEYSTLEERISNITDSEKFYVNGFPVLKNILMLQPKKSDLKKLAKAMDRLADLIEVYEEAQSKLSVIEAVQKELAKLGFSQDQLLVGGLVIKTTLDQKAQQSAVDAVNKFYPAKAPADLRIGLVAIRPGTGEILAMYGGRDYLERQLNDATQSIAQAGSTFKPFALVSALEQGIPLTSMWNGDSPQTFDDAGKPYEVFNYGNEGWGQIDLLFATKHSVNTIFVPLGIKVGPDKVVDVARRAGIPESVAMMPTPSVVLGTSSPHVIDVANAYATFAAQGIKSKPFLVTQVLGSNKGVLYEAKPETQEVFNKDVMADLTYALKGVVTGGTGAAALALGRPAAGKTGTSQSNASAWFSAYTPQIAASVAFFRDNATQSLNGIGGMTSVTGGSFPARIWTQFMKGALKGEPVMDFPAPANIGGLDPVVMTSGGKQKPKP